MNEEIRRKIIESYMDGNTEEAVKLICEFHPASLFKYRRGEDRDVSALKSGKVWIGRASLLDDDDDGRLRIKDVNKVCKVLDSVASWDKKFEDPKYKKAVLEIAKTSKEDSFVCSFSETAENEFMWKRYADNERGFCIEYEFDSLFYAGRLLAPVSYSLKREIEITECKNKAFMVFMNLYTKNEIGNNGESWIDQKEWRIACYEKTLGKLDTEKGKLISVPNPVRVILGKSAPESLKCELKQWIKENDGIKLECR